MTSSARGFDDLVAILHRLRSPGGCPWDAEQTHLSLKPYLIEEAYEVLEAIDGDDDEELRDELGDLLLQVVFHSELAAERGAFHIGDVLEAICAKLVRRHPHVFADTKVSSSEEVARNWTEIKRAERRARGQADSSAIDGVPRALPGLTRAHRLGEKAGSVGFDWESAGQARLKIDEELAEADEAARAGDIEALTEEIGDLLFALSSWSRLSGVHGEEALQQALQKFSARFRSMERDLQDRGRQPTNCSMEELEEAWQDAKARSTRPTGSHGS